MRLRELLDHETFNLELVAGGDDDRERHIAGAHVIEAPDPAPWLAPDWIVLTAGLRLWRKVSDQRRLVRELVEARIAALGFATDIIFQHVPQAILDEAQRLRLPIFVIPYELPFRDVVNFVAQGLVSDELLTMRRTLAMQRYLMHAMRESDAEALVVERLASRLGSDITLLGSSGQVVATRGKAPGAGELWRNLSTVADRRTHIVRGTGGWYGIASPVVSGERFPGWLVVGNPRHLADSTARAILEVASDVIALIWRSRDAQIKHDRILRSALLREIIGRDGALGDPEFAKRMRVLGVGMEVPTRVVVVTCAGDADDVVRLGVTLERHLATTGRAQLYAELEGELVALLPAYALAEGSISGLIGAFRATCEHGFLGISRELAIDTRISGAVVEARLAAKHAARTGESWNHSLVTDLDLIGLVITSIGVDNAYRLAEELLGPLRSREELAQTLKVYFAHRLDVRRAAKHLFVHPNSVRYRLNKIEELLGRTLNDPKTIADLHLALSVLDVSGPSADVIRTPDVLRLS